MDVPRQRVKRFIQGPIIATIVDFWRMILSENVSHIIMLCDTIEQGKMKCEQYWPNEQDEKMEISGKWEASGITNIPLNVHVAIYGIATSISYTYFC